MDFLTPDRWLSNTPRPLKGSNTSLHVTRGYSCKPQASRCKQIQPKAKTASGNSLSAPFSTIYCFPFIIFAGNFQSLEITDPLAQAYASQFTSPEDALLQEISAATRALHPHAHMLSGQVQGKFLEMISCLLQPRRILEIGTFTGYSALCLAKGLLKDGKIHTIELRDQDASVARANFNRSIDAGKIILHVGNALSIIPGLNETWDLVFIDADKVNYTHYYQLVLPMVRPGGLIIADNVLFHGQVLQQPVAGKNAKAIHEFNEYVQQDASVDKVLLTVRDGLLMIRKK